MGSSLSLSLVSLQDVRNQALYEGISVKMYPQDFFLDSFLYLFTCGCTGSSLLHRLFPSCGGWGLLFIAVHGILITVASFDFWEHGL